MGVSVSAICAVECPALASAGDVASVTSESYLHAPRGVQSDTGGWYAEVPSGDSFVNCSALGETSGPGDIAGSSAFIYVNGAGIYENYGQVRWRGVFNPKSPRKFVKLRHFHTIYFPVRYISLDLNIDTIKANTDVCGRYTINGETSPWACITMKP